MKVALICGIFRENTGFLRILCAKCPFFQYALSCARHAPAAPILSRNRAESRPAAANRGVAARKRNVLSFRLHPLLARYLAVRKRNETVLFLD